MHIHRHIRRHLALLGFLLLCSAGSLNALWQIRDWGDALSRVDAYSEANAIREARNFREQGLARNHGLGTAIYPGLYPDAGFAAEPPGPIPGLGPDGVYTHYPPGPAYLLYAAMAVVGPTPISHARLLPIAISWIATLFLGLSIRRRFGPLTGWLVMTACLAQPTFSDASSFLHYDGYAFALLLIEIGLCLGYGYRALPFLLLGFGQGWLSFDYVFLVVCVPVTLELALSRLVPGHAARWRLAAMRCLGAGAGFALAHLLHFAEIWAYFGAFQPALHDLLGAAAHRSGVGEAGGPLAYLIALDQVLFHYLVNRSPLDMAFWPADPGPPFPWQAFRFLGMTLGPWWALLTAIILGRQAWQERRGGVRDHGLPGDWLCVSLAGFATSSLWFAVMLNHAQNHPHFLYRHLFLGFFLSLLFIAVRAQPALTARPASRLVTGIGRIRRASAS